MIFSHRRLQQAVTLQATQQTEMNKPAVRKDSLVFAYRVFFDEKEERR